MILAFDIFFCFLFARSFVHCLQPFFSLLPPLFWEKTHTHTRRRRTRIESAVFVRMYALVIKYTISTFTIVKNRGTRIKRTEQSNAKKKNYLITKDAWFNFWTAHKVQCSFNFRQIIFTLAHITSFHILFLKFFCSLLLVWRCMFFLVFGVYMCMLKRTRNLKINAKPTVKMRCRRIVFLRFFSWFRKC